MIWILATDANIRGSARQRCFLGQNAPLDPGRGNLLQFNGKVTFQPTNELQTSFSLVKQRLVRNDTGRVAFDVNILSARGTYQFTKATFVRAIIEYNTLTSRARGQFLTGWTPSPGTSFYVGYNDDLNLNEVNPLMGQIVPGFRRNSRTFFIKMSYLIRKSFGGGENTGAPFGSKGARCSCPFRFRYCAALATPRPVL